MCLRAAEYAVRGQAQTVTPYTVADLAAQVYDITTEVTTITEAIELLCQQAWRQLCRTLRNASFQGLQPG